LVERAQSFLGGRERVETVKVIDVDVVGAQAPQAGLARRYQVMSRRSDVVGPLPRRNEVLLEIRKVVASSRDGLTQDLLREAGGVNVGGIEEIDAGFHADIDQAGGLSYVSRTPGADEFCATTECAGTKTQGRYFHAGAAQLSKFHGK
jgi:hypothetical protein